MTRAEVVLKAQEMGYTHVETAGGPVKLEAWWPYGKREHQWVSFEWRETVEGLGIAERVKDQRYTREDFVTGVWPLLKVRDRYAAGPAFPLSGQHSKDEDCRVVEDVCVECGVDHSGQCPECQGRGFHREGCSQTA